MDPPVMLHTIKWSDHKKEIIEEQQYLFKKNLECDCVLISAQGQRIQAHQIILSSSSEFFRKILSDLPPMIELPTIYLPDADTCILEAILKFVYTGETTISSNYLTTLLEFCNFLDVKGCVANGFTLNGSGMKIGNDINTFPDKKANEPSKMSWSSEEYLVVTQSSDGVDQTEDTNESSEPDYLEEYLEDDVLMDVKEESVFTDVEYDEGRNEANVSDFIAFEIVDSNEDAESVDDTQGIKRQYRQGTRSTNSQIDKALNEVNNGKTIHRLSVEYNLPRSTLYHRFRNNENLKQNYRQERKSALNNAVHAVLYDRLSLKTAADKYKIPKTAIWREVRKCEQYQPPNKEITVERQNAQLEILSGKSLTSISAKYGKKSIVILLYLC